MALLRSQLNGRMWCELFSNIKWTWTWSIKLSLLTSVNIQHFPKRRKFWSILVSWRPSRTWDLRDTTFEEMFSLVLGASFQIDACEFNESDQLWYIRAHATDQGAALAAEYLEYQKKRMVEMNITLMFGNLLLDMGEYAKAERYFDMILNSSKPNEEEIACIYFNFGRTNRLKGDFARAIRSYEHAYGLHINARPKRLASAGKTLNGLGVVYSEQGKQFKAEECFRQTLKLFKRAIPKGHIDVAGTLINLATIDCYRKDVSASNADRRKKLPFISFEISTIEQSRSISKHNTSTIVLCRSAIPIERSPVWIWATSIGLRVSMRKHASSTNSRSNCKRKPCQVTILTLHEPCIISPLSILTCTTRWKRKSTLNEPKKQPNEHYQKNIQWWHYSIRRRNGWL